MSRRSQIAKVLWQNPEYRRKLSEAHKKPWSEKQHEARRQTTQSGEYGAKVSAALKKQYAEGTRVSPMKGKKHTPESVARMSFWRGKKFSLETRMKMSRSHRRSWVGAEERRQLLRENTRLVNAHLGERAKIGPNKCETIILEILSSLNPLWIFTGAGTLTIGSRCPDFFCKGSNKLVEIFWFLLASRYQRARTRRSLCIVRI
jgi:hypothetical protein